MCRIADFVEGSDELLDPGLLQADTQIETVISRRWSMELPAAGHLDPGVFYLKVVPSRYERLACAERHEAEKKSLEPQHTEERRAPIISLFRVSL